MKQYFGLQTTHQQQVLLHYLSNIIHLNVCRMSTLKFPLKVHILESWLNFELEIYTHVCIQIVLQRPYKTYKTTFCYLACFRIFLLVIFASTPNPNFFTYVMSNNVRLAHYRAQVRLVILKLNEEAKNIIIYKVSCPPSWRIFRSTQWMPVYKVSAQNYINFPVYF